jgi:hypothetical protein
MSAVTSTLLPTGGGTQGPHEKAHQTAGGSQKPVNAPVKNQKGRL